ncbi:MAG: transposase, partial [Paludibacter sp.]|nr:transposase [Paludibacter sp.]
EPEKGTIRCYIIDDTLIEKTGKLIEGVTKVFDHVTQKSVLGLKMLVLGYWDGMNFLGVDFSAHHELGKNNKGGLTKKEQRLQHTKKRKKDSCTEQRNKELNQSKIDSAIEMLKRADKLGLLVDYVLTDSWFTCIELITVVRTMLKGTVHFLGMVVMNRHKFEYKGYTTTGSIALLERKSSHYSRKFKCRYIDAMVHYQGVELRLFLIKYGTKGNFRAVLTANVNLKFAEMMDIYKIRWSIEVFFMECKQYLNLGKYQSTNFDGQIASLTIAMITHTVLTLEKRFSAYLSSFTIYL